MCVLGGRGVVLCCPRPVFKLRTLYRQTDTAVTLCSLPSLTLSLEFTHSLALSLSLNDFNCKSQKKLQVLSIRFQLQLSDLCFDRALLAERCSVASRSPNELVRCAHCASCCVSLLCCLRLRAAAFVRSCFVLALPHTHTLLSLCRSLLL